MSKLFLLLAIATLSSQCLWPHSDIEIPLRNMFSDDFGYTLVGAKPASLDDSSYRYQKGLVDYLHRTFEGSNRFIFREIGQSLWLVNIPEMRRAVSSYSPFRSFIVKKFGSVDEFFDYIRFGDENLFEILDKKDDLIGIALGYGLDNGRFCNRRAELLTYLRKCPITWGYPFEILPCVYYVAPLGRRCVTLCIYRIDKPDPTRPFESLEEEWEWIEQNEWDLSDEAIPEVPYYIWLPTYISCKSGEAKMVHKRFVRARAKLAKQFCSKKPSEAIAQEALKK